MSHLGFSVSYKSVKCTVEIHYKDIISFPNLHQQNKDTNQSRQTKTNTLVFVEAPKRAVWNVLTDVLF